MRNGGKYFALFILWALCAQAQPTVALLWPQGAPGAVGSSDEDKPSLIVFPAPKAKANGAAAVICPGGAYGMLAIEKEGYQVAQWLNSLGVSAFVLQYRLGPAYRHPIEEGDAKRAMRWVRAHAALYHVDARRLGMVGFSAGGHLSATVAVDADSGRAGDADPVERFSCKPAFLVLVYPVITMDPSFTHPASRRNLLGPDPDPKVIDFLSAEKHVTARTPPTFLVHAKTDPIVPFRNSEVFYEALRKAGVPAEFHAYEHGTHAFGLAREGIAPEARDLAGWPASCERWMENQGLFRRDPGK
jgi:acetyl esterase/lipase